MEDLNKSTGSFHSNSRTRDAKRLSTTLANMIYRKFPLANWKQYPHAHSSSSRNHELLVCWVNRISQSLLEALVLELMATLLEETWHHCLWTHCRARLERLLEWFVSNMAVHSEEKWKGPFLAAFLTLDLQKVRQRIRSCRLRSGPSWVIPILLEYQNWRSILVVVEYVTIHWTTSPFKGIYCTLNLDLLLIYCIWFRPLL